MRRAALLLAGLVLLAQATPAGAAADPTTGYWTKTRVGAPVPAQPPDPAPEGGSWISADPSGPVAVTAIRAGADAGSVVAGFRLPVGDAVGPVAVLACPTTESWAPEQGGRFEVAPAADCAAAVETAIEEDALVIALPPELQADEVDLLLTPAPRSAFSLTLDRATAEHVVQAPTASSGSGPLAGGAPSYESWSPPGTGAGASGTPDLGLPASAPGPALPEAALPGAALPEAALPEPATAPEPQPAPAVAAPVPVRPAAVVDDRPVALLATGLLVVLGVLAVRLALQPAVAPRHLGGGARLSRPHATAAAAASATAARGVGRFRAPRVRPPVRI